MIYPLCDKITSAASSRNGSDKDGEDVGGSSSSGKEGLGGPVGLESSDICRDGSSVEGVVLGDSGDESGWAEELLGIDFDGGHIVLHLCARGGIELEVVDELLELLNGTDEVEGLDVSESGSEVAVQIVSTSIAGLHLGEMALTNHAVDETGSKLRDGKKIDSESIVSNRLWVHDEVRVHGGRCDGTNSLG